MVTKTQKKRQGGPTSWFFTYFRLTLKEKRIHTHWKARCARRGQPMVQRFIEMMREDLEKESDLFNK